MCDQERIRYVHHVSHPEAGNLDVGCICAGKMTGDLPLARGREKRVRARSVWIDSPRWIETRNGGERRRMDGGVFLVIPEASLWRASWKTPITEWRNLPGRFGSARATKAALFDYMNRD